MVQGRWHSKITIIDARKGWSRVLRPLGYGQVDEPEDDSMALLMGAEADKPAQDDMPEERLLRELMEAQGQR